MITDYFMITEKSNWLQVIMITDYDYPISGQFITASIKKDHIHVLLVVKSLLHARSFFFRILLLFIHCLLPTC